MSSGDKCPGGQMSEGDRCPRGTNVQGDKCPGGQLSRGTLVRGSHVTPPHNQYNMATCKQVLMIQGPFSLSLSFEHKEFLLNIKIIFLKQDVLQVFRCLQKTQK